jgi:hypothetical protein
MACLRGKAGATRTDRDTGARSGVALRLERGAASYRGGGAGPNPWGTACVQSRRCQTCHRLRLGSPKQQVVYSRSPAAIRRPKKWKWPARGHGPLPGGRAEGRPSTTSHPPRPVGKYLKVLTPGVIPKSVDRQPRTFTATRRACGGVLQRCGIEGGWRGCMSQQKALRQGPPLGSGGHPSRRASGDEERAARRLWG